MSKKTQVHDSKTPYGPTTNSSAGTKGNRGTNADNNHVTPGGALDGSPEGTGSKKSKSL